MNRPEHYLERMGLIRFQTPAALQWIKKNARNHPDLVTDDAKRAVVVGAARNATAFRTGE